MTVAVVLALAGLMLHAGSAGAAAKRDCGPRHAKTVERNRLVRVFATASKSYYACARRGGRRIFLAQHRPDHLVLRGRYVAYSERGRDSLGRFYAVDVLDVLRAQSVAQTGITYGSLEDLVATRHGEAALLATPPDRGERYLLRLDSLGISELARGPDVRALRVRGARLHWREGVAERSAPTANGRRCGRTRGVTNVQLGRDIRVYSVYRSSEDREEEYDDYYACLRPGGRPLRIAHVDVTVYSSSCCPTEEPGAFVFSGRVVAFAAVGCSGAFGCSSELRSFDVGRRRRVREARLTGAVSTVVASPSGNVAALVGGSSSNETEERVVRVDQAGFAELDRGEDLRDLTLDGASLRWLHGGESRTAELP